MFIAISAMAQERTITGTVTGQDDGLPLPGVSVGVKGTNTGTLTGSSGVFTLTVPAGATTVGFTYIGYLGQSKTIGSGGVINAVLISGSKGLNEIIVVGYGIKVIKDVNGAVAHIDGSKIKNSPTSFDNALSGKTAGVQISSSGGTLGDGVSIRVRGIGSISTRSLPLIVIDGIPSNDWENVNILNNGNAILNPLTMLFCQFLDTIQISIQT